MEEIAVVAVDNLTPIVDDDSDAALTAAVETLSTTAATTTISSSAAAVVAAAVAIKKKKKSTNSKSAITSSSDSNTVKKKAAPLAVYCDSSAVGPLFTMISDLHGWKKCTDPKKARLVWVVTQEDLNNAISSATEKQRFSKFPGMNFACSKIALTDALNLARKLFPTEYGFWPESWILPEDLGALRQVMSSSSSKKKETFIIKPDTGSQGDGIFLVNTLRDLESKIYAGNKMDAIVQRYIANPLLVQGLKFDLRIYAMISSLEPLRIQLAKEGLARFCTEQYSAPNASNLHVVTGHLTNYSLNVKSSGFVHNDDPNAENGTKRTMQSVFATLRQQGVDVDLIWERIKNVIVNTSIAMQPVLLECASISTAPNVALNQCFHILGFDIMLDDELQPWLLEVNNSPSLCIDTVYSIEQFTEIHGEEAVQAALTSTSRETQGLLRPCRCMDASGVHFHQNCVVDVAVKKPILEGAINIVLHPNRPLPDAYDCICDGEIDNVDGISLDIITQLFHLYTSIVGTRKILDTYRLHAFAKTCGISSTGPVTIYDVDLMLIKYKKLAASQGGRVGAREFSYIICDIAIKRYANSSLPAAIATLLDTYWSAKRQQQ